MPIDVEALRERAEWYSRQTDQEELNPVIDADDLLELLTDIEQLRAQVAELSKTPTRYKVGEWLRVRRIILDDENKGYFPPNGKAEVIETKGLVELTPSSVCFGYRMRAEDGKEFYADDDDLGKLDA